MVRFAALLSVGIVLGVVAAAPRALAQEEKKETTPVRADSVDFRKLKELMPEKMGDCKRKENSGEKNKIGEVSISQARATYQKEDKDESPRVEIEIMDWAGAGGGTAMGLAMVWAQTEIDKETDDGYEKTVKIKDNPAYEQWHKEDKRGEIQVVVGKRYVLTLRTENLPAGEAKKLVEAFPLDKLAALK